MKNELGSLTLTIDAEALHSVVSSGRLLELAATMAAHAADQISAQIVDHVASAALQKDGLKGGAAANVTFIFEGGDFATVPPRPRWGVGGLERVQQSTLRRVVAPEVQS
jgi:hypothetical protein